MLKLFNRKTQKRRRQSLRNNATIAERKLWSKLKRSQLEGYKFRRQQGVGYYIVDFYCPEKKLAIELDGAIHLAKKAQECDKKRDQFIEAQGIRILRFTNNDVFMNLNGLLEVILDELTTPYSPPQGGGEHMTTPYSPPREGGEQMTTHSFPSSKRRGAGGGEETLCEM
jgi:very-short-patch-repair endonuclease